MPENEREEEVLTRLLNRARSGDAQAEAEILPRVYRELRAIAAHKMRGAGGHTLQPTALVHEAYLRLQGGLASLENRKHFFFAAARAMRDILVEHARQKQSLKRGGDQVHVSTDNLVEPIAVPAEDLLGLDAALERLEQVSPRGFQLVMLRFFAGLSKEQAAETLGISERTGDRDWRTAKAFLRSHLNASADDL